jgi:NTP pyrophosphatase (non-canonical NTP hydrolase)
MRYGEFAVHVDRLFVKPESLVGKMVHAVVGISGEIAEIQECLNRFEAGEGFDFENMIEECGDALFYAQAFCLNSGISLQSVITEDATTDNLDKSARKAVASVGRLLDLVKKTWIYGKEFNADAARLPLAEVLFEIVAFLHYCDMTVFKVFEANYEKLSRRYPDGYTDAAAQLRADKVGEN